MDTTPEKMTCRKCGQDKLKTCFNKGVTKTGYISTCKDCVSEYNHRRRQAKTKGNKKFFNPNQPAF